MRQDIYVVDSFASEPFKGNPAGVCVMERYPSDALLQHIAAEMNHAETAFLVENAPYDYQLRWFTPAVEVNLCGHATLASAHVLRETGRAKPGDRIAFHTMSGPLYAEVQKESVTLDFPSLPGKSIPTPAIIRDAVNVKILACEQNRDNTLIEVKDFAALMACAPDLRALKTLEAIGLIVTTATGVKGYDFASRFFAPGVGIDEDPVTGSAHCFLTPYWAPRLGKQRMHALQASARTGILDVTLAGERVNIGGRAVTTLKGSLLLPEPARIEERVA